MSQTSEIRLEAPPSASLRTPRMRLIGRSVEVALVAVTAFAVTAAMAIAGAALLGIHTRVEESGSMTPALVPGDLLFIKSIRPTDAHVGDVLTFFSSERRIELTHRAISVRRDGNKVEFVTRGDANTGVERWTVLANGTIGREILSIPALGGALEWLRGLPLAVAIWLLAPFVLFSLLRRIWRSG